MTSTTDISPPADDPGITTKQTKDSGPHPSRLNQALAWVGIVAGGLFVVAAIFLAGFFLSSSLGGPRGDHIASGRMACCDKMTPGEMMPGGMTGPGGPMGPAPRSPSITAPHTP
jgi:hypothetical protein